MVMLLGFRGVDGYDFGFGFDLGFTLMGQLGLWWFDKPFCYTYFSPKTIHNFVTLLLIFWLAWVSKAN